MLGGASESLFMFCNEERGNPKVSLTCSDPCRGFDPESDSKAYVLIHYIGLPLTLQSDGILGAWNQNPVAK
jgi:hypothetical protein